MDDKELKNLWNQDNEDMNAYYHNIEPELLTKAKKSSHDILAKIRKNIKIETIFGSIIAIGFPLLFLSDPVFFYVVMGAMVIAVGLSIKVYWGYLKKIKTVNETNVLEALDKKIQILDAYIKRLLTVTYASLIMGFFVGITPSLLSEKTFNWIAILITLVILVPIFWLLKGAIKKYVHALYGRHLTRLQKVRDELMEKE